MRPVEARLLDVAEQIFAGDEEAKGELIRIVLREVTQGESRDGVRAAKACGSAGRCIFCEEPIAGRRRFVCADSECKRAYQRAYKRDARATSEAR